MTSLSADGCPLKTPSHMTASRPMPSMAPMTMHIRLLERIDIDHQAAACQPMHSKSAGDEGWWTGDCKRYLAAAMLQCTLHRRRRRRRCCRRCPPADLLLLLLNVVD